jgi:hypothetical protein
MLPASVRRGSPTGGGNSSIFKDATEAERSAEWRIPTGTAQLTGTTAPSGKLVPLVPSTLPSGLQGVSGLAGILGKEPGSEITDRPCAEWRRQDD